jgi:hypothetical protein
LTSFSCELLFQEQCKMTLDLPKELERHMISTLSNRKHYVVIDNCKSMLKSGGHSLTQRVSGRVVLKEVSMWEEVQDFFQWQGNVAIALDVWTQFRLSNNSGSKHIHSLVLGDGSENTAWQLASFKSSVKEIPYSESNVVIALDKLRIELEDSHECEESTCPIITVVTSMSSIVALNEFTECVVKFKDLRCTITVVDLSGDEVELDWNRCDNRLSHTFNL